MKKLLINILTKYPSDDLNDVLSGDFDRCCIIQDSQIIKSRNRKAPYLLQREDAKPPNQSQPAMINLCKQTQ